MWVVATVIVSVAGEPEEDPTETVLFGYWAWERSPWSPDSWLVREPSVCGRFSRLTHGESFQHT